MSDCWLLLLLNRDPRKGIDGIDFKADSLVKGVMVLYRMLLLLKVALEKV